MVTCPVEKPGHSHPQGISGMQGQLENVPKTVSYAKTKNKDIS